MSGPALLGSNASSLRAALAEGLMLPTAPDNPRPPFLHRVVIVAVVVVLLLAAWYASDVLLLIFGGVLMAVFLRGISDFLARHTPLSPRWSLAIVLLTLTVATILGCWFLAAKFASQFDELSRRLLTAWANVQERLSQYEWGRRLLELAPTGGAATNEPGNGGNQGAPASPLTGGRDILAGAATVVSAGLGALANLVIITFIGIYVAISPALYRDGLLHLIPLPRRPRAAEVLDTVGHTLRWWLIGRVASMTIIGVATTIGLLILGVPLAPALGLIAFVLSFVPYLGPIIAVIPAAAVAFTEDPMSAAYVAGLYLAVETLESYLFAPLIQKWSVDLPPALTIAAQTLMGVLLGLLGIIFATPLTAAAVVIVKMLYVQDVLGDPLDMAGDEKSNAK